LKEERLGQSAIARLVTPKPYQFEGLCDIIDQQEWDRKRTDEALMKDTLDTSSPQTEDKVKNQHVQAVEEWIATTVKETLFEYIKSKALEKTVKKRINEEMARSNLEMNLEEPCEEMVKEDLAMAMKKTVSSMICFGTMKEVVGNHIVNSIDFDEIMAVALETIMKNKLMQERVSERVKK
jgi:predicted O-linked N-acetylglucosamine transferase (SPINDLY family)